MTNLKIKILESVQKNNLKMIPKWKFLLYSSLGVIGLAFTFMLMVFVFSLILFLLSRYGFMYLPLFNFMASIHALAAIPLVLLVCTIALLILIEVISRHYSFSFRRPLAVTLLFSTSCATIISFIVSETPMHEYIRDYMEDHNIKVVSRIYERPMPFRGNGMQDVLRGEVVEVYATGTKIRLFNGMLVTVYASTTLEKKLLMPEVGDDIVAFGKVYNGTFELVGIRPAPRTPFGGEMHPRERNDPSHQDLWQREPLMK